MIAATTMNWQIANRLSRVRRYFDNVLRSIKKKDPIQAMADCAELDYQAQALYKELAAVVNEQKTNQLNEKQSHLQPRPARQDATRNVPP